MMKEKKKKEISWGNTQNIKTEEEAIQSEKSAEPTDPFVCDSNNAVFIKLVRSREDLDSEEGFFHPEYTHQIFTQDEQIDGYKNLRIEILYAATTLDTCISVKFDEARDGKTAQDLFNALTKEVIDWPVRPSPAFVYPCTQSIDQFVSQLEAESPTWRPAGVQVARYTVTDPTTGVDREFEIYRSTTKQVLKFHERLQTFALFYIETMSYIEADDERWQIFTIYEKFRNTAAPTPTDQFAVVGYCTVYHFPYPRRLRISQFLILPPFQRKGHGKQLLQAIYSYVINDEQYAEICVEDPSPDFMKLRDRVDWENFKTYASANKELIERSDWSPELLETIRKAIKITKNQIKKLFIAYKLQTLKRRKPVDEEEYQKIRYLVKRDLFVQNEEQLIALNDAEERKRRLANMYRTLETDFCNCFTL